jgi:hypothetical protein
MKTASRGIYNTGAGPMKKNAIILSIAFMVFTCTEILWAVQADKLIAYPVPFNPRKGERVLKIGFGAPEPATSYRIKLEVFDVNGDLVFNRKYTGVMPVYWNGYNDSGNLVKPGLYLLKVGIEGTGADHSQGKKIIRILINY